MLLRLLMVEVEDMKLEDFSESEMELYLHETMSKKGALSQLKLKTLSQHSRCRDVNVYVRKPSSNSTISRETKCIKPACLFDRSGALHRKDRPTSRLRLVREKDQINSHKSQRTNYIVL